MINLHEKTRKETNKETGVIRKPVTSIQTSEVPFCPGVVYCAPARGHWTIAHTPMLIPGSYMIFLCASACMRGVVLSALEYDGMDRFSMVILNDHDIYEGNLEQIMIDSICEIIDGLDAHPPIVMPFTSCIHHFLSCDQAYIYRVLRERYPDIDFVQCYMIPTIRRGHITPEELMQVCLYDALNENETKEKAVNIIGSNYATLPTGDHYQMLLEAGYTVRDLPKSETYQDYKNMAKSVVNIYSYPVASLSARKLEKRLDQKAIYMPATYNFSDIRQSLESLAELLNIPLPDLNLMQQKAEEALQRAKEVLQDAPIALDHEVLPRFCSLARMLVEHGFCVREIYTDSVAEEEQEDLVWLQEHAPDITFCATNNYACRLSERTTASKTEEIWVAIGQKSAYFTGTNHFINILENNGFWGFDGVCRLSELLIDAYQHPSDVKEIISVKAWGCHG